MNTRSGLSLFELLVSIALLAFISAGLTGALKVTIRTHDRTRAMPPAVSEPIIRHRLRQWLSTAVSPSRLAPFPVDFIGEPDRMEFTTLNLMGFAPEASALRISVVANDDDLEITVSELHDNGDTGMQHVLQLVDLGGSSFRYRVPGSKNFQSSVNSQDGLPGIVEIHAPDSTRRFSVNLLFGSVE